MRPTVRFNFVLALAASAALPAAAIAQGAATAAAKPAAAPSITSDLMGDIAQAERKIMALAKAIPADKWDWRPAPGTRSIGEVLKHVAADNYLLPAAVGSAPDAATGIKGDDYKTAEAYEKRTMDHATTIAELEKSFAHLRGTLQGTTEARLAESIPLFGRQVTVQRTWILTATHLHEHLGQLIAYARSNGVVPPWSQGG
jgi:uncharacterized damage-inducible protein DinB